MVPHQPHSVHNRLILHDMAVTWHHTNSIHQYALYVTCQTHDTPTSYRSVGWPTCPVWSTQCCWRCCWRQWLCGSYWCTTGGCTVCCSSICPGCHWRSATVGWDTQVMWPTSGIMWPQNGIIWYLSEVMWPPKGIMWQLSEVTWLTVPAGKSARVEMLGYHRIWWRPAGTWGESTQITWTDASHRTYFCCHGTDTALRLQFRLSSSSPIEVQAIFSPHKPSDSIALNNYHCVLTLSDNSCVETDLGGEVGALLSPRWLPLLASNRLALATFDGRHKAVYTLVGVYLSILWYQPPSQLCTIPYIYLTLISSIRKSTSPVVEWYRTMNSNLGFIFYSIPDARILLHNDILWSIIAMATETRCFITKWKWLFM